MKMGIGRRYRLKCGVTRKELVDTFDLGGGSVNDVYIDDDYKTIANAEYLIFTTTDKFICSTSAKETHFKYSEWYVADGCKSSSVFQEVVDEVATDNTDSITEALRKQGEFSLKYTPPLPIVPTIQVPPNITTDTVSIPVIEYSISAVDQVAHTKSETDELVAEINNNKHFAALLEAGDVVCSGYRAMKVLIEENNFNCTPQEILNMIAVKNNMRRYYE